MKFKSIEKSKPEPKLGDVKKITKFAFLPTRINSEYCVWLEKYIKVYKFRKVLDRRRSAIYGVNIYKNIWGFKKNKFFTIKEKYYNEN